MQNNVNNDLNEGIHFCHVTADNHVRRPSSDDLERNLEETRNLINMFRGLHDAQFVRLSSETIEVLNLVPGLQARQTDLPFQKIEVFESAWRG
ncbi:hypothetical protein NC652_034220 [Populus alba x Populus x berolinensis]|nr:hypothetical protein NC652_034220 [Populus alba x Populus x berolinensis]